MGIASAGELMEAEEQAERASAALAPIDAPQSSAADVPVDRDKMVPAVGGRAALSGIRRQLNEDDLSAPGTQRLLIDLLDCAERERDDLKPYVGLFHEADKGREVLAEKLKADRSIEVMSGAGLAIGGAIIGLAPYFDSMRGGYGFYSLILGIFLMVGSIVGRLVKK